MENYKEIRNFYNAGDSQREIARKTGNSRNTVKKYSEGSSVPWERKTPERESTVLTQDVKDFVEQCFEEDDREGLKKQKHTAKRIYERLVEEKNFQGSSSTIRHYVQKYKKNRSKAFIPLSFAPGEAMQVDWGEASIYLNENKQKFYFFCGRLCYSCKPFVIGYTHQNEESFLDAFVRIFNKMEGVPSKVIFDNAKVAVKIGYGANAQKQEGYSKLSAHYGFDAEFCNPAQGHEKWLVEGLVGLTRRNILVPVPHVTSLQELNKLLNTRCIKYEQTRIQGKLNTVEVMWAEEKKALLPLPSYKFETAKSINGRVSSLCTVRFQTNDYSVPADYVGKQVGIKGYPETVDIYYEGKKIAEHQRLFGKNEKSCRLIDYLPLLEERGRAVLNALPVKQNLSDEAYAELKANITCKEKVREILRREAGLPAEAKSEKVAPKQISPNKDPVRIKKVPIYTYDSLLKWAQSDQET